MFFKKRYHTLNRGLFAEAISIYSKQINLSEVKGREYIDEIISLNDVLKVKVNYVSYHYQSNFVDCYRLDVATYVEDIQMAKYNFRLDVSSNKELYREWECREKEIIHYMPNQFIDLMNDWSRRVVSEHNKKEEAKERAKEYAKRRKYNREEDVLSKYR